jgi:hypothetical protein
MERPQTIMLLGDQLRVEVRKVKTVWASVIIFWAEGVSFS